MSIDESGTPTLGANEKLVTIEHGVSAVTWPFPASLTFGQLKADAKLKAALGTADNLRALIDGVTMRDAAVVPPGAVVQVETAAAEKHSS